MKTTDKKKKEKERFFTYLIELYNERNKRICLKVGYTNNLNRRFDELEYKYDAYRTEILLFYEFSEKEIALNMENVMRLHFKRKKGAHHIPKDRFQRVKADLNDIKYFNKEAIEQENRYGKGN